MNHDLGCDCESCMAMVQAVLAKAPDGKPFFTEAELYDLAAHMADEEKPDVA